MLTDDPAIEALSRLHNGFDALLDVMEEREAADDHMAITGCGRVEAFVIGKLKAERRRVERRAAAERCVVAQRECIAEHKKPQADTEEVDAP